jgi:hypothetical protein
MNILIKYLERIIIKCKNDLNTNEIEPFKPFE